MHCLPALHRLPFLLLSLILVWTMGCTDPEGATDPGTQAGGSNAGGTGGGDAGGNDSGGSGGGDSGGSAGASGGTDSGGSGGSDSGGSGGSDSGGSDSGGSGGTGGSTDDPGFETHPADQAVEVGSPARFSVVAVGSGELSLRWQRRSGTEWVDLPGETSPSLDLYSVQLGDSGDSFRCLVKNSRDEATSEPGTLSVTAAPGSAIYYVSTTGSDGNSGLTVDEAWKTVAYAVSGDSPAAAGDTIYVKAGLYTDEEISFEKNGLNLIGYKTTPGDRPLVRALTATEQTAFEPHDENEMPHLRGPGRDFENEGGSGILAMDLRDTQGSTVKNFSISEYDYGVYGGNRDKTFNEGHTIENVNVSSIGNTSESYSGLAMTFGSMRTWFSSGNRIKNVVLVNAAAEGINLNGNDNVIDNARVFCNEDGTAAMDYYVMVTGSRNLIKNSLIYRDPDLTTTNSHGFSVKSDTENNPGMPELACEENRFENNAAYNMREGYVVRHRPVQNNTFVSNRAFGTQEISGGCGDGSGIRIRDGASNNHFIDMLVDGCCATVTFDDSSEDEREAGGPGTDNVIDGLKATNVYYALDFSDDLSYNCDECATSPMGTNTIRNSTFQQAQWLFNARRPNAPMRYEDVSFVGVPGQGGFSTGSYLSEVTPSQFTGASFSDVNGGVPAGF